MQGIAHLPADADSNGTTSETREQGVWRGCWDNAEALLTSILLATTLDLRGQGGLRGSCDEISDSIKVCSYLANLCSLVCNLVALSKSQQQQHHHHHHHLGPRPTGADDCACSSLTCSCSRCLFPCIPRSLVCAGLASCNVELRPRCLAPIHT